MKIYVFGNGNLSFQGFQNHYGRLLKTVFFLREVSFLVCDFRGVDTLTLEWLKCVSPDVTVFHVGKRPRYLPDRFRTYVDSWTILGGFKSDEDRDAAALDACTHFLATDFNSDENRKSGTQRNIEHALELGKLRIE